MVDEEVRARAPAQPMLQSIYSITSQKTYATIGKPSVPPETTSLTSRKENKKEWRTQKHLPKHRIGSEVVVSFQGEESGSWRDAKVCVYVWKCATRQASFCVCSGYVVNVSVS